MSFDCEPRWFDTKVTWDIVKIEWRDVTNDGKPELLIWYTNFFGKGLSEYLDVYYIGGEYVTRAARIKYSDGFFQYGELSFKEDRIFWTSTEENNAENLGVWSWDVAFKCFTNPPQPAKDF